MVYSLRTLAGCNMFFIVGMYPHIGHFVFSCRGLLVCNVFDNCLYVIFPVDNFPYHTLPANIYLLVTSRNKT